MLTFLGTILAFVVVGVAIKLLSDAIGRSEGKKGDFRIRKDEARLTEELLRMSGYYDPKNNEQARPGLEGELKSKPEKETRLS
jgi:hypothetical protein